MAKSRNTPSTDLVATVRAHLRPSLCPGSHLVLALSGGVDSVALLAVLVELAGPMRFSLRAVHVNHGISPNAAAWAEFCLRACSRFGVPLEVESVDIGPYRSLGLEAAARRARYEALARQDADFIVLAQHRDDQAETLLLQLLRGAGVAGLAAMPERRALAGSRAVVLRPLLGTSRTSIEGFARDRGIAWIDDESNADVGRQRNFLRHEVMPLLKQRFPAADRTIARAAAHLAESKMLLDVLARMDLGFADRREGIAVSTLRELGHARAKNAIRFHCADLGLPALGTAQLDELWRQLNVAAGDANPLIPLQGWELRRYRGRLYVERKPSHLARVFPEPWNGEPVLPLLALRGTLRFKPEEGRGVSVEKLRGGEVAVRLRRGGERLQPDCRRPRRTLKNLFQEHGFLPWRRDRHPLIYCGDALVSVPGVGDDCRWQAAAGEPGLIVTWEPLAEPDADGQG